MYVAELTDAAPPVCSVTCIGTHLDGLTGTEGAEQVRCRQGAGRPGPPPRQDGPGQSSQQAPIPGWAPTPAGASSPSASSQPCSLRSWKSSTAKVPVPPASMLKVSLTLMRALKQLLPFPWKILMGKKIKILTIEIR